MEEDLVHQITKKVIERLGDTSPKSNTQSLPQTKEKMNREQTNFNLDKSGKVIFLLCGGNQKLDEVYQFMEEISRRASKVFVVMSRAATRILGVPTVRKASQGGTIITEYNESFMEILDKTDCIYVPILSLNTAAKVSLMNADTLATITMVFGRMLSKPVIATTDSLYCCQVEKEKIPDNMNKHIDDIILRLASMGITMLEMDDLIKICSDDGSTTGKYSANKTIVPGCLDGECNECGLCVTTRTDSVMSMIDHGASRIAARPGVGSNIDSSLAKYIDHTLLKADATEKQIKELCEEAVTYSFASVCINPTNVALAAKFTKNSSVKVCTVIGFPLGATTPTVKAIETRDAIANGAEEIDMVINVGALKSGNDARVREDIEAVVAAAKGKAIVKVILETALLTKEEIVKGCLLSKMANANFVKTSTGFSTAGATTEDIRLMRETVGPTMGVKASGGIRSKEIAEKMIAAGATRIGASASIAIVKGSDAGSGKY